MTMNRTAQSADFIYDETLNAMQQADELGGCDGVLYVELMEAISRAALQRARNYAAEVHHATRAELKIASGVNAGRRVVSFDLSQLQPVAKLFAISVEDVQSLCAYHEASR